MWTLNCGCIQLDNKYKEENIVDKTSGSIILPLEVNDDYCRLKEKIIFDYFKIIDNLECGIRTDLEFLLEEISLIQNINTILV